MALLIAADGNTLEHRVAKKFTHATFYLQVATETMEVIEAASAAMKPRSQVLEEAVRRSVDAVITGNLGPHAFSILSAHRLRVAFAPGMPVREAVERYGRGELRMLDAPTLEQSIEEHEALQIQRRWERAHRSGSPSSGRNFTAPTPRGRHHLQQFGGRGH